MTGEADLPEGEGGDEGGGDGLALAVVQPRLGHQVPPELLQRLAVTAQHPQRAEPCVAEYKKRKEGVWLLSKVVALYGTGQ